MFPEFSNKLCALRGATVASTATVVLTFDSKGSDSAKIKVQSGTMATTVTAFTTMKVTESDTVTNASSQSAIVSLTGGTATSSSVGFVLPVSTTANASFSSGGVTEFQIDLRKRKRYLGVSVTPGSTSVLGIEAELFRNKESGDTLDEKHVDNLESTTTTAQRKIVTAL